MIFIFAALLLAVFGSVTSSEADDLIVQLPYGKIRGYVRESDQGNPFYVFQEIPYAAPPVGVNRFQAPKDPIPWNGVKNTTKNKLVCYQPNNPNSTALEMSENCLFLNVFSPVKPGSEQKLPVWFFIHGGGYQMGSYVDFLPNFLIDFQIVFVIINYRLGPLGFLSTRDETIPGNAGLRDQLKAMEWVHENIGLFGGDNARVTVNGGSAGSMSICLHMLGPWKDNKVLFHAAILESGVEVWRTSNSDHREKAFEMGRSLDETFNSSDTKELLDVLQRATPEEIVKVGGSPTPVIEKEGIFSYRPYKSLSTGNFKKMPILIGFTSEESLWMSLLTNVTAMAIEVDRDPSLLLPLNISKENRTSAGSQIKKLYTNTTFLENPGGIIRSRSDLFFVAPICRHAQLASKYSNIFLYQFSYKGGLGLPLNFFMLEGTDKVAHGEEGAYIWSNPNSSKSSDDRLASKRMSKLFTNFVIYQNPTPTVDPLFDNITWPTVDPNRPEKVEYLNINKTLEILSNPRKFQEMFEIIDRYVTPDDI